MVYLSKIYTKSGDQGETGLGDGARVAKDHPRVAAYGTVDELNCFLGLLLTHLKDRAFQEEAGIVQSLQNDLFDVGADLCLPLSQEEKTGQALRIGPQAVARLEHIIDGWNESLSPLDSFVLPGGTMVSAWAHLCRTVCRRAEREVVTLMSKEKINPQILIYLNRLSDLLFVLGRRLNNQGKNDVLWLPGGGRK